MGKKSGKVYVVGHKNPDTDSICSAIAYAHLKKEITGEEYVPRRAGLINEETAYVLQRFGVDAPPLLQNVKLQVKDIDIHKIDGVDPQMSIKDTWQKMKENNIKTIPVLKDEELVGVISTGDIATSYMDVYDNRVLSAAKTQYRNIIKTLDGTLVTGNEHGHFTKGKVAIGASNPDLMEQFIEKDDLVILGNRYESQACAVDIDASCLVVCQNAEVPDELIKKAEEQSIVIIRTPHDTFTVARLINQSIPVKYFMTKTPLTSFQLNDYVDDIKEVMTKKKFRDFPILDRHGRFRGFISRRRFLDVSKKKVILVDHNEKSQAVDGIEEAEIVEIIDHHRLGNIETVGPVFSGISRWAVQRRSCIRCIRRPRLRSAGRLPDFCAPRSFRIHCCSVRLHVRQWMKRRPKSLRRSQRSIWNSWPVRCSGQEAICRARVRKKSASRTLSSLRSTIWYSA